MTQLVVRNSFAISKLDTTALTQKRDAIHKRIYLLYDTQEY